MYNNLAQAVEANITTQLFAVNDIKGKEKLKFILEFKIFFKLKKIIISTKRPFYVYFSIFLSEYNSYFNIFYSLNL